MPKTVTHTFAEETMEAKGRWFRSLTLEERMDLLVAFTNLILENNPEIVKQKYVRPASNRVRILAKE
jgi:hypothetical protein